MIKKFSNNGIGAKFVITPEFSSEIANNGSFFMFLWNDGTEKVTVQIDKQIFALLPGHIACTTYLHEVKIDKNANALKALFFNREFYCIHTYDSEVSCNGLLFFGSNQSPLLKLNDEESDRLRTLFEVLNEEFDIEDSSQEEMLRILLKRFIIRCTRLAKKQLLKNDENQTNVDLVRHFNVLVEQHFKTKKAVSDYAMLMYKSPKTLTNVFGKYSEDSPLQVIHKRIIMEAKRMLLYSDKTVKEIAYELGYTDPAQFSKLFKNQTGKTTTEFKKSKSKLAEGQN